VVERLAKSIVVRVTDDGRGFDPGVRAEWEYWEWRNG
jgi:signal transduction histidine kinase